MPATTAADWIAPMEKQVQLRQAGFSRLRRAFNDPRILEKVRPIIRAQLDAKFCSKR